LNGRTNKKIFSFVRVYNKFVCRHPGKNTMTAGFNARERADEDSDGVKDK
jgi:hypothetical protein